MTRVLRLVLLWTFLCGSMCDFAPARGTLIRGATEDPRGCEPSASVVESRWAISKEAKGSKEKGADGAAERRPSATIFCTPLLPTPFSLNSLVTPHLIWSDLITTAHPQACINAIKQGKTLLAVFFSAALFLEFRGEKIQPSCIPRPHTRLHPQPCFEFFPSSRRAALLTSLFFLSSSLLLRSNYSDLIVSSQ